MFLFCFSASVKKNQNSTINVTYSVIFRDNLKIYSVSKLQLIQKVGYWIIFKI
jgi:hypothetical protein